MEGPLFWTLATLAAVLVGLSKGGLPSVGMLAVPILSLIMNPIVAAGMLLPVFVASDVIGLIAYRKEFDARVLWILAPSAALGIFLGGATASIIPERAVTGLVGAIGLGFVASVFLRRPKEADQRDPAIGPGVFWRALTGFTSFVSHAGGPPYQVYVQPLGLSKLAYAGTTTILFAWVNAVKLIPYWALGQLSPTNLKTAALLFLPAILAVLAGVRLVRIIPDRVFFQLVTWALGLVSLRLLWTAVFG